MAGATSSQDAAHFAGGDLASEQPAGRMGQTQAGEDCRPNPLRIVRTQAPLGLVDDLAELALEAPGSGRASRYEGDALTAVEVAGAPRLAVPLEVLGRRDRDDGGGSNLPRHHGRVGQWTVVDGHVDALLHEVYGAIGHHDLDDDVGEAGEELASLGRRCTRPKTGATVTRTRPEGAVCPRPTRDSAVSRSSTKRTADS